MIVFLNGKFLNARTAKVSIFDHGFLYGDGVYETLRTYGGKVWQFKEHFRRLRSSAKLLRLTLPCSERQLATWVDDLVKRNGFKESRIRITLTRGENGFDFLSCRKPTLCIQVQRLVPQPASVYAKGVKIISLPVQRLLPLAKTTSLLPQILAKHLIAQKKAYEAVYVHGGKVYEGSFTNIYMVSKGVLVTPKNGILLGTTRQALLKFARKVLPVREQNFTLQQLYKADEVFITSAPRGIVPVVAVDGTKIGNGWPGKITRELMEAFDRYIHVSMSR